MSTHPGGLPVHKHARQTTWEGGDRWKDVRGSAATDISGADYLQARPSKSSREFFSPLQLNPFASFMLLQSSPRCSSPGPSTRSADSPQSLCYHPTAFPPEGSSPCVRIQPSRTSPDSLRPAAGCKAEEILRQPSARVPAGTRKAYEENEVHKLATSKRSEGLFDVRV